MLRAENTGHLKLQNDFAAYLRDPQKTAAPERIEERRLGIYCELFFNNLKGFLDATFPVCAEVLGEDRWQQLARDFFAGYRAQSPYFLQIPHEFLNFLENHPSARDDPPYLCELAHYEWLELAVDIAAEDAPAASDIVALEAGAGLAMGIPVLSVARGFLYQYPVHEISQQNNQPQPRPCGLIIYRTQDDQVRFIETNPFTLQLLALLETQTFSGHDALCHLLQQAGLEVSEAAVNGGMSILTQWAEKGLIAGVIPPMVGQP